MSSLERTWGGKIGIIGAIIVGLSGIFSAGWAVYTYYYPSKEISDEGSCSNKNDVHAIIHWHRHANDFQDAKRLEKLLRAAGANASLTQHRDPRPADAIFIDYKVGVCLARIAILNAHHKIKFLFRPDYPAKDGSGKGEHGTIGIGYRSTWLAKDRQDTSEPLSVNKDLINYLIQPGISDDEFNRRLTSITGAG